MSDIDFDHSEAVGKLQGLIDATASRQTALNRQVPHFPQAAAGRDFTGYAQSIQSMLARIGEYDVAKATDDDSAAVFSRFNIEGDQ